ncbi:hypothetical protein FB451DRAFT_1181177 [Mycena latifolia]|nr:hypothetical protein FB451DRAFT_1181177 [Mycena latifolia]
MYVRKNRPRRGPAASDAHSRTCSVRRAFALAMHMYVRDYSRCSCGVHGEERALADTEQTALHVRVAASAQYRVCVRRARARGGRGIRLQGAEAPGLAVVDADAVGAGDRARDAQHRPPHKDLVITPCIRLHDRVPRAARSMPRRDHAPADAMCAPSRLRRVEIARHLRAPGITASRNSTHPHLAERVGAHSTARSGCEWASSTRRSAAEARRTPAAVARTTVRTRLQACVVLAGSSSPPPCESEAQAQPNVKRVRQCARSWAWSCSTMIRRWGAAVQCSGRERGPDLHARELAQRRAGRRVRGALHRKPRAHNAPRMRGHLCARGMRCSTCPARRANLCGAEARIAGAYDVCAVARESKDVRACCVVFVGVVGEGDEEEEVGRQPSRDQRRRRARKQPARGRDRSHAFR